MSFGFSVGDFIAVGELAFVSSFGLSCDCKSAETRKKLYNECYKIVRGAPQEFRLLVNELTSLYASIQILQQALKDPNSTLRQAGPERVQSVTHLESAISESLIRLEKVAKKYEILGSTSERKNYWTRFKWSMEQRDIDGLRAKLVQHNTMLNLLLTAVGNSSLQRIEASNAAMDKELKAIKEYVRVSKDGPTSARKTLVLSSVDDEVFNETLKAALMRAAEIDKPWSTIGIDQWMEAGRWWLQLAQMDLSTVRQIGQATPLAAYTNLIKATWILLELITCHPQVPFLTATTQSEIRQLAAEIKGEYARLSRVGALPPDLNQLDFGDLQIWEIRTRRSLLRPRKDTQEGNYLKIEGGERVMFQRYANVKLRSRTMYLPCILSLLVQENVQSARVIAQDQNGSTIFATLFRDRTFGNADRDPTNVSMAEELFSFRDKIDAQIFECLVNATDFFLHDRKIGNGKPIDLEAYTLIYAVESEYLEAVKRLSEQLSARHDHDQESKSITTAGVALSLAEYYRRCGTPDPIRVIQANISLVRLFDWALRYGHSALVVLMISEEAAWGLTRIWPLIGDSLTNMQSWPSKSFSLPSESEGLLQIINRWPDEAIALTILQSSYGSSVKLQINTMAILHAAEMGLARVARLSLQDIRGDESLCRKLLLEAVRRGCIYGHRDLVQALVRLGFGTNDAWFDHTVGRAAIEQASEAGPDSLVDLVLKENAATRGPFLDGMTLVHSAIQNVSADQKSVMRILTKSFEVKEAKTMNEFSGRRSTARIVIEFEDRFTGSALMYLNGRVTHGSSAEVPEDKCDGFKDFVLLTPAVAEVKRYSHPQTSYTIIMTVLYYDYPPSNSCQGSTDRGVNYEALEFYRQLYEDVFESMPYSSFKERVSTDGQFNVPSVQDIKELVSKISANESSFGAKEIREGNSFLSYFRSAEEIFGNLKAISERWYCSNN